MHQHLIQNEASKPTSSSELVSHFKHRTKSGIAIQTSIVQLFTRRCRVPRCVKLYSKYLQGSAVASPGRCRRGVRSHRWPSRNADSTCSQRSAGERWCRWARSRCCCFLRWPRCRVSATCLTATGPSIARSVSDAGGEGAQRERWWWWWRSRHRMLRRQTGPLLIRWTPRTLRSRPRPLHSVPSLEKKRGEVLTCSWFITQKNGLKHYTSKPCTKWVFKI